MKNIYMYVQDTMADWEHGYLMHALSLQAMLGEAKVKLLTVSKGKKSIKTAGGMTIVPDLNLYDIDTVNTDALLLIGGDSWLNNEQDDVLELASKLLQENILVGAICGATLGLAEKGILDNRYHTSNASFFLSQMSQHYRGHDIIKMRLQFKTENLLLRVLPVLYYGLSLLSRSWACIQKLQLKHGLIIFQRETLVIFLK